MNTDIPQLDWQDWMHRYDQQQSIYLPDREQRFTVMLDVLATLLPVHLGVVARSPAQKHRSSGT